MSREPFHQVRLGHTRIRRVAGVMATAAALTLAASAAAAQFPGQVFPPLLDLFALATGLGSAYLIRAREPLGWWIGIVTVLVTAASFFSYGIPGQAWFQLVYALPLQLYGCITWSRPAAASTEGGLSVGTLSDRNRALCFLAYVAGAFALGTVLQAVYGGAFSAHLWDGAIVAGCVLAQTLLARRKIESWASWIVLVNAPSIALHIHNGAWLYVVLYAFFTANALLGYVDWRRIHLSSFRQPAGTRAFATNSIE